MSISGSPDDEYDIITLQYTEEGLLSVDENREGHAAAFGDDIAIECLAIEFKREIYVFILLGAVPFPTDVPCLKELGVCGVITLNEPYETLVPTSLYNDHGIEHLVIPTRDYCFAPSLSNVKLWTSFMIGFCILH